MTGQAVIEGGKLVCPSCGSHDVQEKDVGLRWNRIASIEQTEDGTFEATAVLGDTDWGSDGLICANCVTELVDPDGFTIVDWI